MNETDTPSNTNTPPAQPQDQAQNPTAPGASTATAPGQAGSESAGPQASEEARDFATVEGDLEKFRDLALRAQADFDNYRKRAAREREDAVRYANASLLEHLLPVIDNFDLGLEAAKQQDPDSIIVQGMAMVQKQLADFFTAQNATPIDTKPGDEFDPKCHEALGHEPHDSIPEGRVIRQLRRGYKLRDRLLRPASVFVSKGNVGAASPPSISDAGPSVA